MVLEDVADRTGTLVVARTSFDADRLGDGDLDVIDELPVPDRLEDAVGEAEGQHVLDRLLAQVMVDPEDLLLVEVLPEHRVELTRRCEVVAERLLDDEARPPGDLLAPLSERSDDRGKRGRGHREVIDAVSAELMRAVQFRQQFGEPVLAGLVGEVGGDVMHRRGELVPGVLAKRITRVLLHGLLHVLAEPVVVVLAARHPDDREARRKQAAQLQRVERRHQLLVRQVAGRAEDDKRARIGRAAQREPLEERVLLFLRFGRGHQCFPGSSGCASVLIA